MKRGTKAKGKISLSWTPEMAYAIGLIAADGSLSKNRRHIDFTSKNRDLVKIYLQCLKRSDIKIGQKKSGISKIKIYYRAQFGDVLFYRWLENIGLTSNKSKTIRSLRIKADYFSDFIRGVWDGDGTLYFSNDSRWKNSHVVSLGFSGGSILFLEWLQQEINKRLNTTGFISKGKNVLQLRYAKNDSEKVFNFMFYEAGLPHLRRKFAKAQKIFTIAGLQMPRWCNW